MSDKFASLLLELADESRPVHAIDLTEISDLTRVQVGQLRFAWNGLRPTRRLELVTAMVEQAETNIHLNFHAVLRSCLADTDERIRRLAIEGLWEDERISLVQPLVGLLADDPAWEVRAAAATSLGRFVLLGVLGEIDEHPARTAEEALWLAWYRPGEPVEVRRRALESLAYTNASGFQDLVRKAYDHEDAHMRQSAVFAMGRSADPRWSRVVLAELASRAPAMRFEAAVAAGEMALRSAIQPLIQAVDDPDGNVREAAVLALGKIGGPAARRALQALVEGADECLAAAAEEALDELTFNSDRLDDLMSDYSDQSPKCRGHAVDWPDDDLYNDDEVFEEQEDDELEWDGGTEDDGEAEDDAEDDDLDWDEGREEDDSLGGKRSWEPWQMFCQT